MFLCDCEFFGLIIKILLFGVGVLVFHYFYFLWNADYWRKKGVFSPNPRSLVGDLPGQVNGKRHLIYDMDDLYKKYKDQHSYIGIYQFREPRLLVFDPEVIKNILIRNFKNFQGTEFYGRMNVDDKLIGQHPFFLIGEAWKTKRAEISPAFTNNRIKAIYPITQEFCEKMIKYIKTELQKSDHDGFDAKDLSSRFTTSVVSNSVYNVDPECFDGGESEILKISTELMSPSKMAYLFMILSTIYPFINKIYKMKFADDRAVKFYYDLMENAMKHREESKIQRIDYLDHLINLKNKKEISDESIAGHAASFLFDGFDTSSSGIASTLYELAKNQEIQEKLRNEILNEMPNEEDFNYDNIMNCQYLDQAFTEALRMHSPGTHLSRFCTESITLDMPKDKKVKFDYGDIIFIPTTSIHMDPEFYSNPEKFDPDRFSPENGGAKSFIDRGVLTIFGIGPRACVGSRFAISQSKIAIATLIKNFKISVNPKTPETFVCHPQAVLLSLEGCYLDFMPLN